MHRIAGRLADGVFLCRSSGSGSPAPDPAASDASDASAAPAAPSAPEEAAETSAEEAETSAWAQDALTAAAQNGFSLEADVPLTREAAAEILYRAWQMENELIAKA